MLTGLQGAGPHPHCIAGSPGCSAGLPGCGLQWTGHGPHPALYRVGRRAPGPAGHSQDCPAGEVLPGRSVPTTDTQPSGGCWAPWHLGRESLQWEPDPLMVPCPGCFLALRPLLPDLSPIPALNPFTRPAPVYMAPETYSPSVGPGHSPKWLSAPTPATTPTGDTGTAGGPAGCPKDPAGCRCPLSPCSAAASGCLCWPSSSGPSQRLWGHGQQHRAGPESWFQWFQQLS